MSLSLLAALAVPLFFAPWETHRLYSQVYAREKAFIAVDNGAVRLGSEARAALEQARHSFDSLEAVELAHDLVHLCARVPGPGAAQCLAEDLALESELETSFSAADALASGRWSFARAETFREGWLLGEALKVERDSVRPPWARIPCEVCGYRFRVRWSRPPAPLVSAAEGAVVGIRWRQVGTKGPWDYRLIRGEDDDSLGAGSGAL